MIREVRDEEGFEDIHLSIILQISITSFGRQVVEEEKSCKEEKSRVVI